MTQSTNLQIRTLELTISAQVKEKKVFRVRRGLLKTQNWARCYKTESLLYV
jgi:hypothetical protein